MTFLSRRGKSVQGEFAPGDIVAWRLPGGLYHIGIVGTTTAPRSHNRIVVHNIGRGARAEDVLHAYTIIGHYRW
jgi:hypothetical protein